jgi:glycosyltransferase involved in cell wall biosynthesis
MFDIWDWTILAAGWILAVVWSYPPIRLALHLRHRKPLTEIDLPDDAAWPRVCVIVPARNEAGAIGACLESLLAQDDANVAIIAVDDRSTDETGAIMDQVAAGKDRLIVIHVDRLPGGWLGKNHANWLAAQHPAAADAEFLLFTDGDVMFSPDCVRRAARYAASRSLDHLCLGPALIYGGFWERAMCNFFGMCYLLRCQTWHLANPRRRNSFTGIGAFNLVRRSAYEAVGTHTRLRLEVTDDYKLGKLLKHGGFRCEVLDSGGAVRLRWQIGLRGVVQGLEKNSFASFDYSLVRALWYLSAVAVVFLAPFVLATIITGPSRWGFVATAVSQVATLGWLSGKGGGPRLVGLTFPICAAVMLWTIARATFLALWRGGIAWRDTFYSLDELKRGCV